MLAAGDTFRAAAIEQLKIWGERTKSPVIAGAQGSDSASLAFNALTASRDGKLDVLLIDTAGRLQNKAELMNELEKVVRVIRKVDASAPHAVLLVLDATVGQNALSQVEAISSYRRCYRPCDDETRRHRARRHPGGAGGKIQIAGAFIASAKASTTSRRSPRAISRRRSPESIVLKDRRWTRPSRSPLFKLATELGPLLVFFVANAKFTCSWLPARHGRGDRGDDRVLCGDASCADHGRWLPA